MAPIQFQCGTCKTTLRAPAEKAGKQLRCPKCKQVATVPDGSAVEAVIAPAHLPPPVPPEANEPDRKDCPYCGEQILASAVKCRHCGEFLDRRKAPAAKAAKPSPKEMTPAEYFVAIVLFPFGIVIGAYWLARRIPKGKQMLTISLLMTAIGGGTVGFLISQDIIRLGSSKPPEPVHVETFDHAPGFPPSEEAKALQRKHLEELMKKRDAMLAPPKPEELAAQPAPIQNALRASLRLEVLHTPDPFGPRAQGSGVILQAEKGSALILTNRHVVDPGFRSSDDLPVEQMPPVHVFYVTGDKAKGKVVWFPPNRMDLALVRAAAPAKGIVEATWRGTGSVLLGEEVFAIGNPTGLGWTLTRGVVSAVRTQKMGDIDLPFIQTDAAINPGNSGGGLYNAKGELVGINTAIRPPEIAQRLGFAIQIGVLKQVAPDFLRSSEKKETPLKPAQKPAPTP